MKSTLKTTYFFLIVFALLSSCSQNTKSNALVAKPNSLENLLSKMQQKTISGDPFQISMVLDSIGFNLPTIQSFASGTYGANWIIIGGQKGGLHSLDNDPPSFRKRVANDTMWVIDVNHGNVAGVPVPAQYKFALSATNAQSFQSGDNLYLCGGFTRSSSTSTQDDVTSNYFFEINLPALVSYVNTNGTTPAINQVFTKVIQDPFVQVTGGELYMTNGVFYLIGGHKYTGKYIPGNEGVYTNAIRQFTLNKQNGNWALTGENSLIDSVNLHRRDFTLVQAINNDDDSLRLVIYGGVFTKDDLAFRNPVYISGLAAGSPEITPDTIMTQVNQYTCANVQTAIKSNLFWLNHISLLGGISYKYYDAKSDSLKVPDIGLELPFSNIISSHLTDGESGTIEFIQLSPEYMLPKYLGSDAVFFPISDYIMDGYNEILDLNKIFQNNTNGPVQIGYFYGGIGSNYKNSTTPDGNHNTFANPYVYRVFMSMPSSN